MNSESLVLGVDRLCGVPARPTYCRGGWIVGNDDLRVLRKTANALVRGPNHAEDFIARLAQVHRDAE